VLPWSRRDVSVGVMVILNAHAPACIALCLDILIAMEEGRPGKLCYYCSRWGWPIVGQALALGKGSCGEGTCL